MPIIAPSAPRVLTAGDPASLYRASRDPELVQVPALLFAMVDGRGDPNTSGAYREALEALFSVSYTLKFALKKELGLDYHVAPLESLWILDDWSWTAMIMQPDAVTPARFAAAVEELKSKKPRPGLDRLRLERFSEGLSAQVMHLGPYSAEGPTIERLHDFIRAQGCTFDLKRQRHHEIYLGDPRRARPERLRTIIRQPVTG